MAFYNVKFLKSAEKDLRKVDISKVGVLISNIESLADDPRPTGCRKLVGSQSSYRIRVGDYRVVYSIEDVIRIVEIQRIRHRKDVYR